MAFPRLALILGLVLAAGLLFFLLLPHARSESALLMVVGLAVVALPLIIAAAPKQAQPEDDPADDGRPVSCCGPRPVGEATRKACGLRPPGDPPASAGTPPTDPQ